MKKIFFSLVVLLLISNCVLLDNLGLNFIKPSIRGSEAKNLILTKALLGAAASDSDITVVTSLATYNTKNLKANKYYNRKDVEDCADLVLIANAGSPNATADEIAIGSFICSPIREDKTFIDWPIPLF